jgi:DNA-binding SARP family transcriptional activator
VDNRTSQQPGASVLPRERLLARLGRAGERKLLLITAPGGYGKTTLVHGYMDRSVGAVFCWLTLDPADASLPIFLQQLARGVARHLSPDVLFSLALEAPADLRAVRDLGRRVAEELGAHVEDRLVIVLDDLHHVAADEQVAAFLDALLQHLPETVSLIMASRIRPYLPLARMQARGELVHLTTADLSFAPDEVRQFFQERFHLELSPDLLPAVLSYTEGWITALQLLGNLLEALPPAQWETFLSRFPEGGALFNFLAEEVFEQQPPHLQAFMLGTCVLSVIQPSVAERMLGVKGAGAILQELAGRNLFTLPVPDTAMTYRYHHLFQAFLQRQVAARRGEAELHRLHGLAGQIHEGLGDLAEAVEHYLRAQQHVCAASLMAEQAEGHLKAIRHDVVRGWLERVPPDLHDSEPDVVYVRAQLAGWSGQNEQLPVLCRRALDLYDARGDYRGLARALGWMTARFFKLRDPSFGSASDRWMVNPDPEVQTYGRMFRAFGRITAGEWDGAFAELEELLTAIPPATRAYFQCLELLGILAFWRGDGGNAIRYGVPLTVGRTALGDFTWGLFIWMGHCLRGDGLGMELYHRQYMAQEIPPAMSRMHQLVGTLGEAIIHLFHRRWEDALACFEALRPSFADPRSGHRGLGAEATFTAQLEMAGIYVRMGRREEARTCLERDLELAAGYPEVAAMAHAAMAQFLVDEEDPEGARNHAARALAVDPPGLDGITTIAVALAASRVAEARGDRAGARQHMGRAVALTVERGCPWYLLHKCAPALLPTLVDVARNQLPGGRPGYSIYAEFRRLGDHAARALAPLLAHQDTAVKAAAFALLDQLQQGAEKRVPVIRVYALGPMRASRYDQPVDTPEWKRTKVKALLVMLLLRRGKPVAKGLLMEAFWPEAAPATARNNLRATLHGLKRALEPDLTAGAPSRYILSDRESLWMGSLDEVWFDLWEFEDLLARGRAAHRSGRSDQALTLLQAACDLSRGAFLPEAAFADYFQDVRSRSEQHYLNVCAELAMDRLNQGDFRSALEYARRALVVDRAAEEAYQVVIQAYLALGDRERAIHAYKTCRKYMRQLLGSEPSTGTRQLLNA